METLLTSTIVAQNKMDLIPGNSSPLHEQIIQYYEDAGPDYEYWSKNFNMHFGYGSVLNFFNREKMLERMNQKVLNSLRVNILKSSSLLDMGCGLGATLRHAAIKYPRAKLTGITLVPWQIQKGEELNEKAFLQKRIQLVRGDYTNMNFAAGSFDAAYALESACHCPGDAKEAFISEMYRVLKTGGSFAITDGFIKNPNRKFNAITWKCYQIICHNWALPSMAGIESFCDTLRKYGFKDIVVEDLSWKVAPSALHSPYVITSFLVRKFFKREKLQQQSISNLKGSLMSLLLGMCRSKFGYYLIKGIKA